MAAAAAAAGDANDAPRRQTWGVVLGDGRTVDLEDVVKSTLVVARSILKDNDHYIRLVQDALDAMARSARRAKESHRGVLSQGSELADLSIIIHTLGTLIESATALDHYISLQENELSAIDVQMVDLRLDFLKSYGLVQACASHQLRLLTSVWM